MLLKHWENHTTAEGLLCAANTEHLVKAQATWLDELERQCRSGTRNEDLLLWERRFLLPALVEAQRTQAGHVLVCGDRIEGIIVTANEPQPSWRIPGALMTYVRYLATAPWNRDGLILERGFLGIGRLLVARAVLNSVARGHDGRVGLHSLSEAKDFYDSLGFNCPGADPMDRRRARFELPAEAALVPLAEIGAHLIHNPDIL